MNILFFSNFLDVAATRLESVETKIWFKNNVWAANGVTPKTPFTWDCTTTITELNKVPYDGLVLDLISLKGPRAFERQYITRMVLRLIEDRPTSFFLIMNQATYDYLKAESIKNLATLPNLFIRDAQRDTDIKPLKKFLKVETR